MQKDDSCCEKARYLPHFLLCPRLQYTFVRHACQARTIPLSSLQHSTALTPPARWRSYVPQQTRKAACGHRTQWDPTSSTRSPEIKWGNLFSDYPT
jgi:hypothetical protein